MNDMHQVHSCLDSKCRPEGNDLSILRIGFGALYEVREKERWVGGGGRLGGEEGLC